MDVIDTHHRSLLPAPAPSRRIFVVTSPASGFALAVQPVSADTITTDTSGLTAADAGIPVPQVEAMWEALKAAGKNTVIVIYPDTPHGFHADYRPSYRPEQAKDGWKRPQAWFKDHGAG
jgi:carboxymethylenebutenolidase